MISGNLQSLFPLNIIINLIQILLNKSKIIYNIDNFKQQTYIPTYMKPFATISNSMTPTIINKLPKSYAIKTTSISNTGNPPRNRYPIKQNNNISSNNNNNNTNPNSNNNNTGNNIKKAAVPQSTKINQQLSPNPQQNIHIIKKRIPAINKQIKPITQQIHQQQQISPTRIVPQPQQFKPIIQHILYQNQSQLSQVQHRYMQRWIKTQPQQNNKNIQIIKSKQQYIPYIPQIHHIQYQDYSELSQKQPYNYQYSRIIKNQQIKTIPKYQPIIHHIQYDDQSQISQKQCKYMSRIMKIPTKQQQPTIIPKYQPIIHHLQYQSQSQISQKQIVYYTHRVIKQQILNQSNNNIIIPVINKYQPIIHHIQYQDTSQISQKQYNSYQRVVRKQDEIVNKNKLQKIISIVPKYQSIIHHIQYQSQSQISCKQRYSYHRQIKTQPVQDKQVIPVNSFQKLRINIKQQQELIQNKPHKIYQRTYSTKNIRQVPDVIQKPIPRQNYRLQQQTYIKSAQPILNDKFAYHRKYIPLQNKQKIKEQPIIPTTKQQQPIDNNQQEQYQEVDVLELKAIQPIVI